MKPIDFREANKTLGKSIDTNDYGIRPLRVYTDGRQCISCWRMSLKERLSALLFGRVWVDMLTGGTQPPIWAACTKPVFVKQTGDETDE